MAGVVLTHHQSVGRGEGQQPRFNGNSNAISLDSDEESVSGIPITHRGQSESGRRRLSRNESEKLRRIRIKNYMMELASLVPSIVTAHKRLDKTSILRLTVNFLRIHNELMVLAVKDGTSCPDFIRFEKLRSILMQILDGFILIIDSNGTILYTSESIMKYLGISVVDVLGLPVSCILHPEDEQKVYPLLTQPASPTHCESERQCRSTYVRLLTQTKGQPDHYDLMHLIGHTKDIPAGRNGTTVHRSSQVFIGVFRPIDTDPKPDPPRPFSDLNLDQYISRHDLNGTTIDADARAAIITGYCPIEMHGLSAYEFIHHADIPFAVNAHFTMLRTNGNTIPQTFLRLKCKNGSYLYSNVNSHIVLNMLTKKPQYLISVNIIMEAKEGQNQLEQQRRRLQQLELNCPNDNPELSRDLAGDILNSAGKYTVSEQVHHPAVHATHPPTSPTDSSSSGSIMSICPLTDTERSNGSTHSGTESQLSAFSSHCDASVSPGVLDRRDSLDMDIDTLVDDGSLIDWVTRPTSGYSTAGSSDMLLDDSLDVIESQKFNNEDTNINMYRPDKEFTLLKQINLSGDKQHKPCVTSNFGVQEKSEILPNRSFENEVYINAAGDKSARHPMLFRLLTCESSDGSESS